MVSINKRAMQLYYTINRIQMYIALGYTLPNVYLILHGSVVSLGEKTNLNISVRFIRSARSVVYDDVITVFK